MGTCCLAAGDEHNNPQLNHLFLMQTGLLIGCLAIHCSKGNGNGDDLSIRWLGWRGPTRSALLCSCGVCVHAQLGGGN